ncbi:hypothetical protein RI129_005867 [Pyrocoelia pectoralis]|uniref:Uncharacterized protein n=1 Tax=Pyrocoelia pectoralis TaxID=417401 RepID=A0AAN7ZHT9_9COLE
MQEDAEKKERALANVEKEKQELYSNLKKEKRSSTNLKQQLQDERDFYFKEKEHYCQEMNDCRKLKKKLSESIISKQEKETNVEILECKTQITKLQEALNQTLEANYNLSVKFLRMKNTKTNLKHRLKQHDLDHKKGMDNLVKQVNSVKTNLEEVIDKRFMFPISPSNRKYLQVIKENGLLMYDNLCLQMEIDRLTQRIDRIKYSQSNKDIKQKYKFISKNATTQTGEQHSSAKLKKSQQNVILTSVREEKSHSKVIKVFERTETVGTPQIIMLENDIPGMNTKLEESVHANKIKEYSSNNSSFRAHSAPDLV